MLFFQRAGRVDLAVTQSLRWFVQAAHGLVLRFSGLVMLQSDTGEEKQQQLEASKNETHYVLSPTSSSRLCSNS